MSASEQNLFSAQTVHRRQYKRRILVRVLCRLVSFLSDNREEAIKAQEKAVELSPDNEAYQQKLDKYREQK